MAVLFTRSLDAARAGDLSVAAATLCLYEDGTPPRWLPGNGADECFATHVSLSERFERAFAARPAAESPDLKGDMASREVCADVKPVSIDVDTGGLVLSNMRICRRRAEARERLRAKYPEASATLDAAP